MYILRNFLAAIFIVMSCANASASTEESREKVRFEVRLNFSPGSYDKLEAMAERFRSEKTRHAGGTWKLTDYYFVFHNTWVGKKNPWDSNSKNRSRDWSFMHQMIDSWAAQFPQSPTPIIVRSIVLLREAWEVRGPGYAKSVPPTAWKKFEKLIQKAHDNLRNTKAISARDPHWYATMATIHKARGSSRYALMADVEEGINKFPQYYQAYFNAIESFLPKWGGSVDELESFADYALKKTSQSQGNAIYARIYWYLFQSEFRYHLFQASHVRWDVMKSGIEDVLKVYQDEWNLQNFAVFACLAEDRPMTARLFAKIKKQPIATVWPDPNYFEHCKDWSSQEA